MDVDSDKMFCLGGKDEEKLGAVQSPEEWFLTQVFEFLRESQIFIILRN